MNTTAFWDLIDLGRKEIKTTTDLPLWLESHLALQSVEYIAEYYQRFYELACLSYDRRLWAAAGLIMKFCSDDKFLDFRAWLIAKGQKVFEAAIANPDSLVDVELDGDFGLPILFSMNYVAEEAYRAKVGEIADITDIINDVPELVLRNPSVLDGVQDKLPSMFQKLFAKYGGCFREG